MLEHLQIAGWYCSAMVFLNIGLIAWTAARWTRERRLNGPRPRDAPPDAFLMSVAVTFTPLMTLTALAGETVIRELLPRSAFGVVWATLILGDLAAWPMSLISLGAYKLWRPGPYLLPLLWGNAISAASALFLLLMYLGGAL